MLKDSLCRCRVTSGQRSNQEQEKAHSQDWLCHASGLLSSARTKNRKRRTAKNRCATRRATMTMTRREMCLLLPAAMLPAAAAPLLEASEQDTSLPSGSYAFDKLSVRTAPSGVQTRAIFKGKLAT